MTSKNGSRSLFRIAVATLSVSLLALLLAFGLRLARRPKGSQPYADSRDEVPINRISKLRSRALNKSSPTRLSPPLPSDEPAGPERTDAVDSRTRFRENIERFKSQPRNDVWAKAAESAFSSDLKTVAATTESSIVEFSCRSSSCFGRVEWSDPTVAQQRWPQYLSYGYARNCKRGILLDDNFPGGRRRGSLFFDCAE